MVVLATRNGNKQVQGSKKFLVYSGVQNPVPTRKPIAWKHESFYNKAFNIYPSIGVSGMLPVDRYCLSEPYNEIHIIKAWE